jgi:hypothetical protein
MELRDFIVTPIILILVYAGAYLVRPHVTDSVTRVYFFPALTLKLAAAISLGLLYQFYYGGGDTFNFHTIGSRIVWEAFMDSPDKGLKLLFSKGEYIGETYDYATKIYFYRDQSSFFVIRIAAIFDLLTFSSYAGTTLLFAVFSFAGSWAFFVAMYRQTPQLRSWIALAILFIPSVAFWGSGLMKDTLTFACLGFMTYSISNLFISRHRRLGSIILLLISAWVIFSVKKYILLCFLPAAFSWIYLEQLVRLRSLVLKILISPFVAAMIIAIGYYSIELIGKDDPRYSLDKISETAQITAYDIGFFTGRDAGSGYSLGKLDGSVKSMVVLAPQAINVSLFRPYLWEVKNPLMLLSAVESLVLLLFTLYVVFKKGSKIFRSLQDPNVAFCLLFSITFAFAVGVSTFNFGTLSRYKIPLLPFYTLALIYILNHKKRDRKFEVLDATE